MNSLQIDIKEPLIDKQQDKQLEENDPIPWKECISNILKLSIPSTCCSFILKLQDVLNIIFIGQMNSKEMLSGVGLANMAIQFLGSQAIQGLNSALSTFVSQASGAGNMELCGVYLNKVRFLIVCFFVPSALALLQSEKILLYFGQDKIVSMYAQLYIQYYLPGFFLQNINDAQRKFLNSLGKNNVPLTSQFIGLIFHISFSWYFVIHLNLGVAGTGISGALTNLIVFTINIIYTSQIQEIKESLIWPDRRCFVGLYEYLKIGIPSVVMQVLDGCAWHLMTFTAGYFGVTNQASNIVVMNIVIMFYQMAVGLQDASTALIGQRIGRQDIKNAKIYFKVFNILTLVIIAFCILIQIVFRDQIVSILTKNIEVKECVYSIIWLITIEIFPDIYQGLLKGMIIALALQNKAVYINLISLWLINLGLQYLLAFKLQMGLKGIWIAQVIKEFILVATYLFLVLNKDWYASGSDSKKRQELEIQEGKIHE